MTKQELVNKLWGLGHPEANMGWSKRQLEEYLAGIEKARTMSLEELEELLRSQGKL